MVTVRGVANIGEDCRRSELKNPQQFVPTPLTTAPNGAYNPTDIQFKRGDAMLKLFVQCSILVVTLSVLIPPVSSAEESREIAVRALLREAEKLIELALPQEALPVLDKVRADYPSTEAATYAGLRRAQALMFAHSYDEAIAEATQVVAASG
jgi:hypothetical protein